MLRWNEKVVSNVKCWNDCDWDECHTLQIPHAALQSSLVAETWLAWHSMPLSLAWVRFNLKFAVWSYKDPWCGSCRWRSCLRRYLNARASGRHNPQSTSTCIPHAHKATAFHWKQIWEGEQWACARRCMLSRKTCLLDLESLLAFLTIILGLAFGRCGSWDIIHFHISHDDA